jgi:hypothetical protein
VENPLALTKNQTLEQSLKELDKVLQAELVSFDKIKNLLFVFETYFLGNFNFKKIENNRNTNMPELYGTKMENIKPENESKKEWIKRKAVAGIFNTLIVMTEALDSLERMDFFSKGGPLFFARESARLFCSGKSGSRSAMLRSFGKVFLFL